MLPKAHLTSDSGLSEWHEWVTTPLWLSGSLRPFLYSSSVYSCHLFLIFSASVRSLPFLSFIVLILGWNVPLIPSIFLKRSLVFPILLFSYTSLHCSFKKAFLSLHDIFQNSSVGFSSVQFNSFAQLCLTVCNPMDCSMAGFPVHHQLRELAQTHVHRVSDAIQPSHSLLSPSPPTFSLSQHQGLSQWVSSSHQVAKVLEFQV